MDAIVREERINIPMRDGTLLAASVTRPGEGGPFPTVLTRSPYDRTNAAMQGEMWAKAGYAFVRQDVRGRFDSEGEFYPFRDDPQDGFDTIEWIAAQPWCDGRIGMTGASHVGTVQNLVAPTRPPHLVTAIPEFAPASVYHRWWYHGGAFRLGFNLAWVLLLALDNTRHYPKKMAKLAAARTDVTVTPEQMRALDLRPLWHEWSFREFEAVAGTFGNRWFEEFMEHPDYGPFWHGYDFERQHAEVDTPQLHIGGWYDTFCQGTIDSFVSLRKRAKTDEARNGQRLIMGPWRHVNWGERSVGEIDYGDGLLEVEPFATRRAWFDRHLRGSEAEGDGKPVRIFVMGANEWRWEEDWPLPGTQYTDFYLHSDGRLDREPPGAPGAEEPRSYSYDPRDPVTTLGGCEWVNYPCGPFDQAPLDSRADVLRFETAPLPEDIEVTGQVFARIWASSSAVDTDFTAKLVDVYPDGRAYNICDGIVRARYRDGFEAQRLLAPGEAYEFEIDLWSTSQVFKAGHRIRVDLSSSNFPRFDANPNTGVSAFACSGEGEPVVAENTVYFERERPSRVVLPGIPPKV